MSPLLMDLVALALNEVGVKELPRGAVVEADAILVIG